MPSTFILITIALIISTASALWLIPYIIKWHKKRGLVVDDMNKMDKRKVPGLGGLALVLSYFFAITSVLALDLIFKIDGINLSLLLPGLLSIIIMAFVGFADDVLMFPIRPIKPVLALLASIPMMAINYDSASIFNVPYVGEINLYLLYPLIVIPFIIVFASNAINIMADFDGLTPGNGVIISVFLFTAAYFSNQPTAMVLVAALVGALIVFFFFNKYPARVFTGNIGTLFVGSVFAVAAIAGNIKYTLLILLIPYVIHLILQQRITLDRKTIKVRPRERGVIHRSGVLLSEYKKAYGLTHLLMQRVKNITEKKLVYYLFAFEIVCGAIAIFFHINELI